MPILRIGEALTSLGHDHRRDSCDAGLAQQKLDRSVPLGETLVRMGVVSRGQLQTALVRKMGYPLVNLQLFPAAAEALRKVGHGAARRLQVMPLMVHEGRLVVALDDPASRHAALDEVEFIAQMKVMPVARPMPRPRRRAAQRPTRRSARTAATAALDAASTQPAASSSTWPAPANCCETLEKEGAAAPTTDAPIEQSDNSAGAA